MSFNPPGCQGGSLSIAGFPSPKKNTVGFDASKYSEFRLTVAMRKQNSLIHSSMGLSEKKGISTTQIPWLVTIVSIICWPTLGGYTNHLQTNPNISQHTALMVPFQACQCFWVQVLTPARIIITGWIIAIPKILLVETC